LSIVRAIMELHEGNISVASQPGDDFSLLFKKFKKRCRFLACCFVVGIELPVQPPKETIMDNSVQIVIPHLVCEGAADALEFYKKAFNAVETMRMPGPNGRLMHAAITIGESTVMLADDFPEYGGLGPKALKGSPVTLHITSPDVDAAFKQAVDAGASVHAAGRYVLGRPLQPGDRSVRPPLVDRHPHQGHDAGRNAGRHATAMPIRSTPCVS
jgi:uncharacterized glyoxalase superfamily protein PhnB